MDYKDLENGLNTATRLMLYTTIMDTQKQSRQLLTDFCILTLNSSARFIKLFPQRTKEVTEG